MAKKNLKKLNDYEKKADFPKRPNFCNWMKSLPKNAAKMTILQIKPIAISDPNLEKWPPRFPDLSQCDYFLWSYLKSGVFNPRNLDDLKVNIKRVIKNIRTNTLKKAILNFSKRCDIIIMKLYMK